MAEESKKPMPEKDSKEPAGKSNNPVEDKRKKYCTDILSMVKEKAAGDKGFRILMKRSCGKLLSISDGRTIGMFFSAFKGRFPQPYEEDKVFLASCLRCLWDDGEYSGPMPLAYAVRYMDEFSQGAFRRRLLTLMDMPWDTDGFFALKLSRLVVFCRSKGIVIDCADLMSDLLAWDYVGLKVQKKWARLFNMGSSPGKEEVEQQ